jgi:hypothetical protein
VDPRVLDYVDILVAEAAPKRDLVDALRGAGVDVRAAAATTSGELLEEIGRLLARAQREGSVRADIGLAELMALLSGLLIALQSPSHAAADPSRMLAVLRDGLTV